MPRRFTPSFLGLRDPKETKPTQQRKRHAMQDEPMVSTCVADSWEAAWKLAIAKKAQEHIQVL